MKVAAHHELCRKRQSELACAVTLMSFDHTAGAPCILHACAACCADVASHGCGMALCPHGMLSSVAHQNAHSKNLTESAELTMQVV